MWQRNSARYYCTLGLCLMAPFLMAGVLWDEAKERSVADKLSRDLEPGQIVWLAVADDREFPAIFTRAVPEVDGSTAIILVHGMGGHPDWPEVISPLRVLLAGKGWTTLSLQMPVLPPEAPLADYGKTLDENHLRISAAVQHLKNYGYEKVVLAGYGFGAASAAHYLAAGNHHEIHAFAGISMLARKYLDPALDLHASLGKLDLPVLDIYGSEDLKTIINTADERRVAARKNGGSPQYEQVIVWNADHYFTGHDQELVNHIDRWLGQVMPDKKESRPD
jgi:pimeloyl-ACP methyl ester carboxylesterase